MNLDMRHNDNVEPGFFMSFNGMFCHIATTHNFPFIGKQTQFVYVVGPDRMLYQIPPCAFESFLPQVSSDPVGHGKQAMFKEMRRLRGCFPYRITWGALDTKTGEYATGADATMRKANDWNRKGREVHRYS